MANEIEDTFDKLKAGAKSVAKKMTDPDKDLAMNMKKRKTKNILLRSKAQLIIKLKIL